MGWNFDNSYARLPDRFYTRANPTPVRDPNLVLLNQNLALELGLDIPTAVDSAAANATAVDATAVDATVVDATAANATAVDSEAANATVAVALAQIFAGNQLPNDAEPLSMAYAGHQFGYFSMLGDGRAHLLGEQLSPTGRRMDIQLKGSGRTPYGRRGDGRAALGPMLREYIISEAMFGLGIPTTRSLAVVTTGEAVFREEVLRGAILTRVASSHLRVGSFEYFTGKKDADGLRELADYAIARHYPDVDSGDRSGSRYLEFLSRVMERQISLICAWMRVGFIHGVMNTDNMAISGETIDYGPCAFMDTYDPKTVFSSIDQAGRYSFGNQPYIAQWNLARFGETLLPLIDEDVKQAGEKASAVIHSYTLAFEKEWLAMMRRKLGLFVKSRSAASTDSASKKDSADSTASASKKDSAASTDKDLIMDLLKQMQYAGADYTNTFRDLTEFGEPQSNLRKNSKFLDWHRRWRERLGSNSESAEVSRALMQENNPAIIARNHRVEAALVAAEKEEDVFKIKDLPPIRELMVAIRNPYTLKATHAAFAIPPKPEERVLATFCGT